MNKRWIIGIIILLLGVGVAAALGAFDSEPPPPKPAVMAPKPAAAPEKSAIEQAKEDADKAAKSAAAAAKQAAADAEAAAKQAAADAKAAVEQAAKDAEAAASKLAADAKVAAEKVAADAKAAASTAAKAVTKQAEAAQKAINEAASGAGKVADEAVKDAQDGAKAAGDAVKKAYDKSKDAAKRAIQPPGSGDIDKGSNLVPTDMTEPKGPTLAAAKTAPATEPAVSPFQRGPQDGKDAPSRRTPGKSTAGADPTSVKTPLALARPQAAMGNGADTTSAPPAQSQPSFDVAQVEANGAAVIAGQAAPGAKIILRADDNSIVGAATAGPDGSWAILSEKSLPNGETALRIEATDAQGNTTIAPQVLIVSKQPGKKPLVITQADTAQTPSRVLQEPKPEQQSADAKRTGTDGPIRTQDGALAVGTVDYDNEGRLSVQGTAPPGAQVSVDVDGKAVGAATADKSGNWALTTPPGAATGGARIGATAVLIDGGKIAAITTIDGASNTSPLLRVSLPFAPVGLIKEFPRGHLVVVQPGNSLWRIARRTYGNGIRYTVIYAANAGQIHNPDLIYPGQIFHTPKPAQQG